MIFLYAYLLVGFVIGYWQARDCWQHGGGDGIPSHSWGWTLYWWLLVILCWGFIVLGMYVIGPLRRRKFWQSLGNKVFG